LIGLVIMVIGVTLFTKQHYLLDLVGAAADVSRGDPCGNYLGFQPPGAEIDREDEGGRCLLTNHPAGSIIDPAAFLGSRC
jgi:hypothetical protein